jgi:hypothetical protein
MARRSRAPAPSESDTVGDFNPAELEAQAAAPPAGDSPPNAGEEGGRHGVENAPAAGEAPAARAAASRGPGRGWSGRFEQPVAYRKFTLRDAGGADKILFTFQLPPGDTKPPEAVIDVLRDHKYWKDGQPYGLAEDAKTNDASYATGLAFGTNPKHPKAWVLPNNELGRAVADSIDQALDGLAKRMEAEGRSPG